MGCRIASVGMMHRREALRGEGGGVVSIRVCCHTRLCTAPHRQRIGSSRVRNALSTSDAPPGAGVCAPASLPATLNLSLPSAVCSDATDRPDVSRPAACPSLLATAAAVIVHAVFFFRTRASKDAGRGREGWDGSVPDDALGGCTSRCCGGGRGTWLGVFERGHGSPRGAVS